MPKKPSTIADWRISVGLNQTKLAVACGTNQPSIANLENLGIFPRVEVVRKCAEVLGVSTDQLCDEADKIRAKIAAAARRKGAKKKAARS